jgi:hypothetical protein
VRAHGLVSSAAPAPPKEAGHPGHARRRQPGTLKCKAQRDWVFSHNEGHSKKKMTCPCVYLINFRGTNQPQNIIFLDFFLVRFWAFLGKWSVQKHDKNIFIKSPCRKLFPRKFSENRQNFRYQFFLDFFGFIAFSGAS